MDLKHFIKEGQNYKIKPNYTFPTVIIIFLALFSWFSYVADIQIVMWIFLSLLVLVILGFKSDTFEINPINRTIIRKQGLIQPKAIVSFDDIIEFESISTTYIFIRVNTALAMYYRTPEGKEKTINLYQGFTKRAIQEVLNDIENIIGNERN